MRFLFDIGYVLGRALDAFHQGLLWGESHTFRKGFGEGTTFTHPLEKGKK